MHEFKHGELETPQGRTVENPKQAKAIAVNEAGAFKFKSEEENAKSYRRTTKRERSAGPAASDKSKSELYEEAKARGIPGRSAMNKGELARALKT